MTRSWVGAHVLMTGDSVTDCGRRTDPAGLGHGYVRLLAEGPLRDARVTNTGVGGDRLADLAARWDADVLDREPDLLSVLIGVNDTWRRFDTGLPSPVAEFESTYRDLIDRLHARRPDAVVVLVEPFVLPVVLEQHRWWPEDLAARVDVVHRLAADHDAVLVPAHTHLTALAADRDPVHLAADGVHPTDVGHHELADLWWRTVSAARS
ncbi:MAG TPA: SGNH/GDSL hydrolase family protein [Cellulomonas sp.]